MKKWFGMVLSVVITMGLLTACGSGDIEDQIANVVQSEDTHVLGVKGGTPNAYPGKTYGEAFEKFFGSPAWKYFVGTKEGADEDGDGKPDYTEENVDIVEFTGYCTYQDVEVKALIQFTLSKDDDTFEATYLSFNDVPQNMFMLSALLEAAFTNEDIDDAVEAELDGEDASANLLTYKDDSGVNEEMPVGSYTDYQEWGGYYDDGWLDTELTFSLYSDGTQDPGCGYIATYFRGMEASGKLYYLGGNEFCWENNGYDSVSPEIYYIYAVKEGDTYQLELYNSDGEYEVTYIQYEQMIP